MGKENIKKIVPSEARDAGKIDLVAADGIIMKMHHMPWLKNKQENLGEKREVEMSSKGAGANSKAKSKKKNGKSKKATNASKQNTPLGTITMGTGSDGFKTAWQDGNGAGALFTGAEAANDHDDDLELRKAMEESLKSHQLEAEIRVALEAEMDAKFNEQCRIAESPFFPKVEEEAERSEDEDTWSSVPKRNLPSPECEATNTCDSNNNAGVDGSRGSKISVIEAQKVVGQPITVRENEETNVAREKMEIGNSSMENHSVSAAVTPRGFDIFGRYNGCTEQHAFMGRGARKKEREYFQQCQEQKIISSNLSQDSGKSDTSTNEIMIATPPPNYRPKFVGASPLVNDRFHYVKKDFVNTNFRRIEEPEINLARCINDETTDRNRDRPDKMEINSARSSNVETIDRKCVRPEKPEDNSARYNNVETINRNRPEKPQVHSARVNNVDMTDRNRDRPEKSDVYSTRYNNVETADRNRDRPEKKEMYSARDKKVESTSARAEKKIPMVQKVAENSSNDKKIESFISSSYDETFKVSSSPNPRDLSNVTNTENLYLRDFNSRHNPPENDDYIPLERESTSNLPNARASTSNVPNARSTSEWGAASAATRPNDEPSANSRQNYSRPNFPYMKKYSPPVSSIDEPVAPYERMLTYDPLLYNLLLQRQILDGCQHAFLLPVNHRANFQTKQQPAIDNGENNSNVQGNQEFPINPVMALPVIIPQADCSNIRNFPANLDGRSDAQTYVLVKGVDSTGNFVGTNVSIDSPNLPNPHQNSAIGGPRMIAGTHTYSPLWENLLTDRQASHSSSGQFDPNVGSASNGNFADRPESTTNYEDTSPKNHPKVLRSHDDNAEYHRQPDPTIDRSKSENFSARTSHNRHGQSGSSRRNGSSRGNGPNGGFRGNENSRYGDSRGKSRSVKKY